MRTDLKQTVALQTIWHTAVTEEMLRAEAARMAAETRMPGRLREIHAALGDDPLLILECLVRPLLVDRMVRERLSAATPGRPWEEWWALTAPGLDETQAQTIAASRGHSADIARPLETSGSCSPLQQWVVGNLGHPAFPQHRFCHTAVWTGSVLLVWGGKDKTGPLNSGVRYDPATDTFSAMSSVNAPTARSGHTAVWTGTRMIVWGGLGSPASP